MTNPSNIKQAGATSNHELSPSDSSDARTPDKTIGQVKYAGHQKKNEGGAGKPESSPLESQKQGGIGGP